MSNSNEELTITEEGDVEFDFGFENFRAMGFQFTGVLKQCQIKQPEKAEYSFVDRKTGNTVTKKAKPQLELLIEPLSFATKSGNPIPEYLPLTHNVRSKLGIFVEHLRDLGLNMGNDPTRLEGMVFEWETKEVDFGGSDPVKINVPIALASDEAAGNRDSSGAAGTGTVTRPAASARTALSPDERMGIAAALAGARPGGELAAVARSEFGSNPRVIAGVADKSLITSLIEEGVLTRGSDGEYRATAA